jgi:hypothetical protein
MLPTVTQAVFAVLCLSSTPPATVPQLTTIDATTEASLADWDRKVAHLIHRGELKLREERPSDDGKRQDEWYVQVHDGVPVIGTEVWREVEGKKTLALEGAFYEGITLNTQPKLTLEEARVVFITLAKGSPGPSLAPVLVVLPQADKFVLVYQARVLTSTDLTLYSIDASSGDVVASEPEPRAQP